MAKSGSAIRDQLQKVASLYEAGKLREALALATILAAEHRDIPLLSFMTGNILFAQGRLAEALGNYEKTLQLKPELAEAHNNAANILTMLGKHEAAIEHCRRALRIRPSFVEAHNILGNALTAMERHEEAIASFRTALKLKPGYAPAHNGMGNALNAAGRFEDAKLSCEEALRLRPDFAEAHNNLGNAYLSLDRAEEAVGSYQAALRIKPGFAGALSNLGNALNALGRPEEAIACCRKALQMASSLADAHRVMGAAFLALDQHAMARREFEEALKLRPDFPDALIGLAKSLENQSMLGEARAAAERAVALAPGNAKAHRALADVLEAQGYGELARLSLTAAFGLDSTSASAWIAQGRKHLKDGKLDEAQTAYERALTLDPRNVSARYSLTQTHRTREGDSNFLALAAEAENITSLPETRAIPLHFALGKCYDDTGQYDLAFRHFEEGARVKRKRLTYNADDTRHYVESIQRSFTAATIERFAGQGFASKAPTVIVGMSRSGKSLTESILARHPSVFPGGELPDLREISKRPHGGAMANYSFSLEGVTPAALSAMGESYVTALMARAPGAMRIIDTTPTNFFRIGLIHLILPNARIVHVRRDPLDTCLLNFIRLYDYGHAHTYDLTELGRYYRDYECLMGHWRAILPAGSFHEIRYENLVTDPEEEIRGLLNYCGLEWNETCLNFQAPEQGAYAGSAAQPRHSPDRNSIGMWRDYEKHLGQLREALGTLGRHEEESRANIKTAPDIDAASISALRDEGERMLAAGKLEEAQAEFERILELDPKDLIARFSLTRLGPVREGDSNMLALIEAAKHAASLPAPQAIAMHFALGKCFDDTGQYDKAFAHFEAGARIKRGRLTYSAGKREQYAEGIRRFFTAAAIERLTGQGFPANLPIFIVGMSRSGKTLTESILASHPSVTPGGELPYLKDIYNPSGEAAADYPLFLEDIAPAALGAMGERHAKALMSRFPGAERITDTMPRNFFNVGLIHLILPNARIIHIRRDPLDTCLLNFTRLYGRGHSHTYDLTEVARYYRSYAALMDHWRAVLPQGSFHEIQYENLVAEPEKEIRALLNYCGLECQETCLEAGRTLHRNAIGKWRHYEKHVGPLIEALGHPAEGA